MRRALPAKAGRLWLPVAVAVLGAGCSGACSGGSPGTDGRDAALEAGADREPLPDAEPGLDAADAAPPADACSATTIQLPPSGETRVLQVSAWWPYVLYDDRRDSENWSDLFLYDLRTCAESVLADGPRNQYVGSLWQDRLTFSAPSDIDLDNNALWLMDLGSSRLHELPNTLWSAEDVFNGRYVLARKNTSSAIDSPTQVYLYDTSSETGVALQDLPSEHHSISPTHGAWVAPGGPGWDVYYVELATLEVHHVQSTYDPWVVHTTTWGDWLLWETDAGGTRSVHALRYGSGEELQLTEPEEWAGFPVVRQDILCYRTGRWAGPWNGVDLAVMDLGTGVVRRVTQAPDIGFKCAAVLPEQGWLVYMRQPTGDDHLNEVWATNLRARGILDAQGHVVPEGQ